MQILKSKTEKAENFQKCLIIKARLRILSHFKANFCVSNPKFGVIFIIILVVMEAEMIYTGRLLDNDEN